MYTQVHSFVHPLKPIPSPPIMRAISNQKKADIIALLEQGLSARRISQRAGVGLATVSKVRQQLPDQRIPASKCGRPRVISDRQTRRIVRMLESGGYSTVPEIQKSGVFEGEKVPSCSTIRRLLREAGVMQKRVPEQRAPQGPALPPAPARRRSERVERQVERRPSKQRR